MLKNQDMQSSAGINETLLVQIIRFISVESSQEN